MDRFLTFMKLKPRFHMDPNAPHCYSVLPSLQGTIPAESYLCGSQCLHLCWEQDQGVLSIGIYTVSSVQAAPSSVGLGLAVTVTVPANTRTGS